MTLEYIRYRLQNSDDSFWPATSAGFNRYTLFALCSEYVDSVKLESVKSKHEKKKR